MKQYLKKLPFLIILLVIIIFGKELKNISFEDIMRWSPENLAIAFLFIMGLFAAKSLTVMIPLFALYVGVGTLFPPVDAIIVNFCGLLVGLTFPYLLGRFSASDTVGHLEEKYTRLKLVIELCESHEVFACYFIRVVGIVPKDVGSMVLGAAEIGYPKYLRGSLLGMAPAMILYTFWGNVLNNISFFAFFGLLFITSAAISFLGLRRIVGSDWKKFLH